MKSKETFTRRWMACSEPMAKALSKAGYRTETRGGTKMVLAEPSPLFSAICGSGSVLEAREIATEMCWR